MTTIVFPLFSSKHPSAMAAATAAPPLMPTHRPSFMARSLAVVMALSLCTDRILSMIERSHTLGMKPAYLGHMFRILLGYIILILTILM